MAVAPALPWRKTSLEVMRGRLAVPAAVGVVVVVACVLGGIHGIEPLLAFGLGAFAAGSAGRALVLSVRGAYRGARSGGASPARSAAAGWRGFVGRANGGMVVHIGVVVIAIGLAAATSFLHRGELHLSKGQSATFAGHTIAFVGTRQVTSPSHSAFEAVLRVDGGGMFYPAISQFGSGTQAVGTPAIDSSWRNDLYLTIDSIPTTGHRLDLRRGRAAPGHVVVDRGRAGRRRLGAVGHPRPASPSHRSGVRPGGGSNGADPRRPPGPRTDGHDPRPEAEADPLPVGAGDPG